MKKYLPWLFLAVAIVAFALYWFVFRLPPGLESKGDSSTFSSIASLITSALSLIAAVLTFVTKVKSKS